MSGRNERLQSSIVEMGKLMNLGKDEVKAALRARKNIVYASTLAVIAAFVVQNVSWGTLRYTGACINDFLQIARFL